MLSSTRVPTAVLLALLASSCGGNDKTDEGEGAGAAPPPGRIGQVMVEVGHRFETAGRASIAERWPLAEYEVHEILEIFEADMTVVPLPGDCDDEGADAAYETLRSRWLPELRSAAGAEDAALFRERFRGASATCNQCHSACQVPFIQVPAVPGMEVPRVERAGAPATLEPEPEPAPGEAPDGDDEEAERAPEGGPTEVLDPWS